MERFKIETLNNENRMSTQELLQLIQAKINEGYTDFEINGCGQHNIGGSSWAKDRSQTLKFLVRNPGQRVGAMGMKGTSIVVEGSVPADTGWLNSGAEIVVKGDCGDTAAHCAASGEIYVGGRVGTRSGALMKHDPKFKTPEFWVLKNTGSFSFEFMGGGIAVVCGFDCDGMKSVLGERSCGGMVGGTVYARGKVENLASCVEVVELNEGDIEFLRSGMKRFLDKIARPELFATLTNFKEWHKIQTIATAKKERMSVAEFRKKEWIEGGIFGDFITDDYAVNELAGTGDARCRLPQWNKELCVGCDICVKNCPQNAISSTDKIYNSDDNKCIGCGICAALCPRKAWTMNDNTKEIPSKRVL